MDANSETNKFIRSQAFSQGGRDFRDWAAECTDFPAEVAGMALGHAVSDKKAAYNRNDLFGKRRRVIAILRAS